MYKIILLITLFTNFAYAKDLGVDGHVFSISEVNLVEYIKHFLNVKKDYLNEQIKQNIAQIKQAVVAPKKVLGISETKEERSYTYDPTYTVPETVCDEQGKILMHKGMKYNPLDYVMLDNQLIFIDGSNDNHIEFAKKYDEKDKIILVNGVPMEIEKKLKRRIYFDQDGMLVKKFGITHVPATVVAKDKLIHITEYKVSDVQ